MSSEAGTTGKAAVNGVDIHYEVKGSGPALVCLPGALGSGRTDFGPQLDNLCEHFTVVAFDPRGYGLSQPPKRDFPAGFLERDCDDAAALMRALGHASYHVMGWSDGANSAVFLATKYPSEVEKLVLFGGNPTVEEDDLELYKATADLSQWSARMREPLERIYGAYLQPLWTQWNDSMMAIHAQGGNIYKDRLCDVAAPTLVVHGDKDPMVPLGHAYAIAHGIPGARLQRFPAGKHNLHLRFADEFNKLVREFLSSS